MNKKFKKKINLLKLQLTTAIFLLIVLLISGFFIFSPISLRQVAKALVNPSYYQKQNNDQLLPAEWNNLPDDFLDKQDPAGDTMAGPLTVPSIITGSCTGCGSSGSTIEDTNGNNLRMVCGESSPANWEQYEESGVPQLDDLTTYVSTAAAGFSTVVKYIAALDGTAGMWRTTGGSSIYEHSNTGFRVYVDDYNPEVMTPTQALTWSWKILWCAVGY